MRAYFWHVRRVSRLRLLMHRLRGRDPSQYFLTGNAGDLVARDVVKLAYGARAQHASEGGRRLLCVGSIAHHLQPGDVVCGIGVRGVVPSRDQAPCRIFGLRGPITYERFRAAGHDLSELRFLKDPGLLLRFMVPDRALPPEPGKVVFIPHYRERAMHRRRGLPRGIQLVDIDDEPLALARHILSAELVYASSLHGIVFAHALERPCVYVAPQTEEPSLKYEDYFASMDLTFPRPLLRIADARTAPRPDSPASVKITREEFDFPSEEVLRDAGVWTR